MGRCLLLVYSVGVLIRVVGVLWWNDGKVGVVIFFYLKII